MQDPTTRMVNETLINGFLSDDSSLRKEAQEGVEDYLRMRLYEDGFARRIQPPTKVEPSDLDRQVDTDKPVIILDKEPNAPAAYSVPFGTLPVGHYIKGPRFRVMFDRIMSRRFRADVNTLLTYDMDIKQILEDISRPRRFAVRDRHQVLARVAEAYAADSGGHGVHRARVASRVHRVDRSPRVDLPLGIGVRYPARVDAQVLVPPRGQLLPLPVDRAGGA